MTDGTWWETEGRHVKVLQYFEVVGFYLGPWAKISSVVIAVVTLFGVLMTQVRMGFIQGRALAGRPVRTEGFQGCGRGKQGMGGQVQGNCLVPWVTRAPPLE